MSTLNELKTAKCSAVDALTYNKTKQWSFEHNSVTHILQLRDAIDRTNWLTLKTRADRLVNDCYHDRLLPMRTESNAIVWATATEVQRIIDEMVEFGSTVLESAWAHKDAINALQTEAEVEAYDITVNWPV